MPSILEIKTKYEKKAKLDAYIVVSEYPSLVPEIENTGVMDKKYYV